MKREYAVSDSWLVQHGPMPRGVVVLHRWLYNCWSIVRCDHRLMRRLERR